MQLKKYKYFYYSLLILVILSLSTVGIRLLSKNVISQYKKYKKIYIKDKKESFAFPEGAVDDDAQPICREVDEYFYFESNENNYTEEVCQKVLKDLPGIAELTKKKSFSSVFDLCIYLNSLDHRALEYKCLQDYARKYFDTVSYYGLRSYVNYLERFYQLPIIALIRNKEFDKAQYLSNELIRRILLLDLPPLNTVSPYNRVVINEMYLTSFLLEDVTDTYKGSHYIDSLVPVSKGYAIEVDSNIDTKYDTILFKDYKRYYAALYKFRQKDYLEASIAFEEVANNTHRSFVKELAILMKIRCFLWEFIGEGKKEQSLYKAFLNQLRGKIAVKISY
jgi:hypothetical protein